MNFAGIPNELKGSLQENLITLLVRSNKHCRTIVDSVPLTLWSNEAIREIAVAAYTYIDKYGRAPKDHLPDLLEDLILKMKPAKADAVVTVLENIHRLATSDGFNEDFAVSQLSRFVRQQKVKDTVVRVVEATEAGDVDAADAVIAEYQRFQEQYGPVTGVELIRGSDLPMQPTDWLWNGYLPLGMLVLLAGPKGTLKTSVAMSFAATLTAPINSKGARWPDRSRRAEPLDVFIWTGEDDPKRTLKPRLVAMGADMDRVHFVGAYSDGDGRRSFDPGTDMAKLADAAARLGRRIGLTIVDSIVSAVPGDSHKNAETRRGLQPLLDFAQQFDCTALGITHFSKGTSGRDPIERVTGSLAFAALARVVLGTVKMKEPDELGRDRLLTRIASNVGPDGGGFYYAPEQVEVQRSPLIMAQKVLWRGPAEGSAKELLDRAESGKPKPGEFLRALLTDKGPMSENDVVAVAGEQGYTKKQMQNAADYLNVRRRKKGLDDSRWSLPKPADISKGKN